MLKDSERERKMTDKTGINERMDDLPCGRRGCTSGRVETVLSSAASSVEMKGGKDAERQKPAGEIDSSWT